MAPLLRSFRDAWVADLRAHPELQGKHRLTTIYPDGTQKDCCLGRACKLLGVKVDHIKPLDTDEVDYEEGKKVVVYIGEMISMPGYSVARLATGTDDTAGQDDLDQVPGLVVDSFTHAERDISLGEPGDGYSLVSLANLNDAGFTFPQIADIIEYFYDTVEG